MKKVYKIFFLSIVFIFLSTFNPISFKKNLDEDNKFFQIKHIVEDAGACFAFPSQSLYIETIPSERPEVYIPPENSETPSELNSDSSTSLSILLLIFLYSSYKDVLMYGCLFGINFNS